MLQICFAGIIRFKLSFAQTNVLTETEPIVISNENQIKCQISHFKQPNINLNYLEEIIYSSEMPSILDYSTEYLYDSDFSIWHILQTYILYSNSKVDLSRLTYLR